MSSRNFFHTSTHSKYEHLLRHQMMNNLFFNNTTYKFSSKDLETFEKPGFFNSKKGCHKHRLTEELLSGQKINIDRFKYKDKFNDSAVKELLNDIESFFKKPISKHICNVYGLALDNDFIEIFSEPMDISLKELYPKYHEKMGKFDEDLLGIITVSTIKAAKYCLENYNIDLEIRPETILINTRGEIKLCCLDFSIKDPNPEYYWSPEKHEQLQDQSNAKQHVWSMGITLMEILLNRYPFIDKVPLVSYLIVFN